VLSECEHLQALGYKRAGDNKDPTKRESRALEQNFNPASSPRLASHSAAQV